jgi:hypothetical protein
MAVWGAVRKLRATRTLIKSKLPFELIIILLASVGPPILQPVVAQTVPAMTVGTSSWQDYFGSNPACVYPLNPYLCNEGPPVTVGGYLTTDGSCTFLYDGQGVNYVVWNLPRRQQYPTGTYQVYGYVYPDWPLGQPFPPYPFQRTICTGVPLYAIPPYIQSLGSGGSYPSQCNSPYCWIPGGLGNIVTVHGWLPTTGVSTGCVNLFADQDQRTVRYVLWNVGSNYLPGYVAVTGVFQQMSSCGGTVLSVISITPL